MEFISCLHSAGTDFIHLVIDIRKDYPMGTVMLFLIPQYLFFIITGFEAYFISMMHLELYLVQQGFRNSIVWIELTINGMSAIAVYLGRFARLNSWDLFIRPIDLTHWIQTVFLSPDGLAVIAVLFILFTIAHRLLKRVNIGLLQPKQAFQAF